MPYKKYSLCILRTRYVFYMSYKHRAYILTILLTTYKNTYITSHYYYCNISYLLSVSTYLSKKDLPKTLGIRVNCGIGTGPGVQRAR